MFGLVHAADGAYKVFGSVYAVPASIAGVKVARFDGGAYYLSYTCSNTQLTVSAGVTVTGSLSVSLFGGVFVVDVSDNRVDRTKASIRVCEALAVAGKVYEELYDGSFDAVKHRVTFFSEGGSDRFAFWLDGFRVEVSRF